MLADLVGVGLAYIMAAQTPASQCHEKPQHSAQHLLACHALQQFIADCLPGVTNVLAWVGRVLIVCQVAWGVRCGLLNALVAGHCGCCALVVCSCCFPPGEHRHWLHEDHWLMVLEGELVGQEGSAVLPHRQQAQAPIPLQVLLRW